MASDEPPKVEASDGEKRAFPPVFGRKFRRYISGSSDSPSDIETDSDIPTKKGRNKKFRTFLYKSNQQTNYKDDDDSSGENLSRLQSHLLSLVREKTAKNKYVDKLLKTTEASPRDVGAGRENVILDDAKFVTVEDDRMEFADSRVSIASYVDSMDASSSMMNISKDLLLNDSQKEEAEKVSKGIILLEKAFKDYSHLIKKYPIEVRMVNLSYSVPYTEAEAKITTVYNSSFVYKAVKGFKHLMTTSKDLASADVTHTKQVLDNISLCLKPGKM